MWRKKKEPVVDKHLDHGLNGNHDHRDTPLNKPLESDGKQCYCHCPLHPPPEPEVKTMPCGHKMGGRNLIVCIDGTANQFGTKNTNVIELYNLILKGASDNQCTWYNSGIGTYARPHWASFQYACQVVWHMVDLAIAWDFDKTVQGAYRWLSDNYQEGDCIFLFGFSRGAFQVRALSGMIEKVGLIHKGNEMQIPFAYELYADPESDKEQAAAVGSAQDVSMAKRFKQAFSRPDVKVHFVGAWDTVSSIGIARKKRVLPLTTEGMTHVCYFRHALALDERRVKFLPEYAWGGTTLPPPGEEARVKRSDTSHGDRALPHVLEVWFPGTHSDIGGGNANNAGMDRSRPPLRWMASQAAELGLRMSTFKRELLSSEQIEFQESLTGFWHVFELLPFQRLTFATGPGINSTTQKPHLWSSRQIHEGQKIHYSFVLGETTRPYVPKARPQTEDPKFWDTLRSAPLQNSTKLLEIEMFYCAADAVNKILAGERVDDAISRIFADEAGPQLLYDEVIETLRSWDRREPRLDLSVKSQLLRSTIDILGNDSTNLKIEKWTQVPTLVTDLLRSDSVDDRKVARDFQRQFIKDVNFLFELRGHSLWVEAIAISPDGKHIISGSGDNTIRVWDLETEKQVGELLPGLGRTGTVRSVAISPDSKHIVSGSSDKTIRIWDLETGVRVRQPLRGHTNDVRSVAISPDSKCIVSGSDDRTIRIWDLETGAQVGGPLQGHAGAVYSLAISPEGKRIISASADHTIRIWDWEAGVQAGEPLRGHTDFVLSVAISPDGEWIVSGSRDETIRIWNADTGAQVGEPLRGHTDPVYSVAISSDGKRIVSGSSDQMIRIWDLETGAQVGEPLQGHTGEVRSVAASPDGRRIVSGSFDNTIRIWSAHGILV